MVLVFNGQKSLKPCASCIRIYSYNAMSSVNRTENASESESMLYLALKRTTAFPSPGQSQTA